MNAVYFLRPVGAAGPIKIGCSFSPEARLRTYLTWSPVPLEIAALIRGGGSGLENRLHHHFRAQWLHHEWFAPSEELSAVIDSAAAGTFDVEMLRPRGRGMALRRDPHRAGAAA
jgi:hypothetical protein